MRSLLALVAILPLLGLGWLSERQVREGLETRTEILEVREAATRLEYAVQLEIHLLEERSYVQGMRMAIALGYPVSMLSAFGSGDFDVEVERSAAGVDEALAVLDVPELAEQIGLARDTMGERGDTELDAASGHYIEAIAQSRDLVVATAADLVTQSAALDDGSRVVAMARLVETASALQAEQSSMAIAYFAALVGVDFIETDGMALVRTQTRYRDAAERLEFFLASATTSPELEAAAAAVRDSDAVNSLLDVIADGTTAIEDGESFAVDLDNQNEAILAIAGPYVAADESRLLHEQLTLAALGDLDPLVVEAWDAERTTNVIVSAGALAVLVLTAIAIFVVGRLVIGPLSDLATGAENLRRGATEARITPHGPVEIRAGAEALNEAMDHIRHVEKQALALAAGRIEDPVLEDTVAGSLGASLHQAVERLRDSLAERERFRRRLAHEATHDGLTGLPNRSAALAHLENTIARTARSTTTAAVLFVDLDGFKAVNDQHGHQTGDLLLQAIARRLVDQCRAGDHVARLGGDEFLIIAEPVDGAEDAMGLADRVSAAIAEPFSAARGSFRPSACVGVAVAESGGTPDSLIRDADLAVYQAKADGPGSTALCTDEMRSRVVEEADLEAAIRRAIDDGEFELHYQSTIDAGTSLPNAIEALVRWRRPGQGMVRPDEFIPFAERSDLIIEMDRWVIDAGIAQLAEWSGHPELGDLSMALNVSGRHLGKGALYATVRAALDRHGVDPRKLTIEVTESALLEDLASAARSLDMLRADGVRIAIDDFGTGYTSLAHLRTLPVDILKIDRSFIANLDNADDLSLVKLIVDTGHLLGARVTAEGVETDDQASILRTLGSDTLQGYRFSRPLTAGELAAAVAELSALA